MAPPLRLLLALALVAAPTALGAHPPQVMPKLDSDPGGSDVCWDPFHDPTEPPHMGPCSLVGYVHCILEHLDPVVCGEPVLVHVNRDPQRVLP